MSSTRISQILESGFLINEETEYKILIDEIVICFDSKFITHHTMTEILIKNYIKYVVTPGHDIDKFQNMYRTKFETATKVFSDLISYAQNKYPNFIPPKLEEIPFQFI